MYENTLEKYLVDRVTEAGGLCIKLVDQGRKGFPDRTVVWELGRVHFIELKTLTGKLSPSQSRYIETLENKGCPVYVLRNRTQIDWYIERNR